MTPAWSVPGAAVRRPVTVLMVCLAVVMLGTVSYGGLAVDLLPDVGTPRITLLTTADALSLAPQEVERLITTLLENAVARVSGVRRITSTSREGMSVVTVEFPWGTDLDLAALHVREAVDNESQNLPEGVDRPAVLRWDPGSEPVMGVAVAGAGSLGALREMVENIVVARMEQVIGIAGAQVTGGAQREIHVNLDPDKMALFGVTIADIEQALSSANASLQSGNLLQGALRYQVRAMGEFRTVQEIETVVIGTDPGQRRVQLRDVGTVSEGTRPRMAGALLNGEQAIGVLLYKEAGSNTIDAVAAAEEALDELRAQYPELTIEVAFENASFISEAIDSVVQNIALGGLFAFAVLFLFLRDPRNPILIGIAIPVSIIATFVLCYFAGITLNIMTLGGLALGAGLLVDNSIVVLENIFRHRQQGTPSDEAARRGAEEVAMAVTAATFTTIAVFLPIAYVHGVAGELFAAQAWTVTFALLASLVVSLSVLPMLASRFLRLGEDLHGDDEPADGARRQSETLRDDTDADREPHAAMVAEAEIGAEIGRDAADDDAGKEAPSEGRLRRWRRGAGRGASGLADTLLSVPLFWIKMAVRVASWLLSPVLVLFAGIYEGFARIYHRGLVWALNHRFLTVIGVAALLAWGVSVALSLPWELMPRVNTGRFEVTVDTPPGTPFARLEEIVRQLETTARSFDAVGSSFATLGADPGAIASGASGALSLAPTRASITVVMAGERSRLGSDAAADAMGGVRAKAAALNDVQVVVDPQSSPLQRLLGFGSASFQVLVRGDDMDRLQVLADEVGRRLATIDGLADINARSAEGNPEIRLRVKRETAARYGVSVSDVTKALQGALQGTIPTQFVEFDRRIDIRVLAIGDQHSVEALLDQPYQTQVGPVPLRELVEYTQTVGPREIQRRDRVRELPVTAALSGIPLSTAVEAAEPLLEDMEWPLGYAYRIGGEREEVDASFRSLTWALLLAAALVYMVMAAQFESLVHPLVILFTLPLGWVGVVTGLWLTGLTLNVVALIGGVVLTGIVVNDGIVKIDTINRLRAGGMARREAVLRGSELRLRPILMTTITTMFALIPLALGLGAGAELQRPLAIAVIGGEFTGTLLTLVVLPVIYELVEPRGRRQAT